MTSGGELLLHDEAERLAREILALQADDRMPAFTAAILKYRKCLYAKHRHISQRVLTRRAEQFGLLVLDRITSATHRRQLRENERKSR